VSGANVPPTRRELDLSGVPCPLNWVRTRLTLEAMAPGQELWVRLDAGEPRESVPRSAREDGHAVQEDRELVRIVRR
jgi:TusA-related sulfurtransferase